MPLIVFQRRFDQTITDSTIGPSQFFLSFLACMGTQGKQRWHRKCQIGFCRNSSLLQSTEEVSSILGAFETFTQPPQVFPRVQARIMTIGPDKFECVAADRFNRLEIIPPRSVEYRIGRNIGPEQHSFTFASGTRTTIAESPQSHQALMAIAPQNGQLRTADLSYAGWRRETHCRILFCARSRAMANFKPGTCRQP
jgi:hypothetical protein